MSAAGKSRPARERCLPVAQIYEVQGAERHGTDQAMITLVVGDEANPPKKHGLRAGRDGWRAVIVRLCTEDTQLRDEVKEALR